MSRPAVFIDRDGTLIREAEYLADPAGVMVLPGAAAGVRKLRAAGYLIVVTSNQSGVARGYFDEETVRRVNGRMHALLAAEQAAPDAVYYCPHYVQGTVPAYAIACDCRKPGPGMLRAAAQDLDIDLGCSWVVGDKASDVEFGRANGLRAVLVLTGYGESTRAGGFAPGAEPNAVAPDLAAAAETILQSGAGDRSGSSGPSGRSKR
jgi:D-glycero-D-manno-heptose 1,7-bisphosphate phosphatase